MDQKDTSVMSGTDEWHNSCKELEEPERSPESSFQPLSTRAPTTLKRVNLKSRKAQDNYRVKRTEDFEARNSGPLALSATQQQTLDALRNYNNEQDLDFDEDNEIRIEDVLDGTVAAEISHGGQELLDAARAIEEEREEETERVRAHLPSMTPLLEGDQIEYIVLFMNGRCMISASRWYAATEPDPDLPRLVAARVARTRPLAINNDGVPFGKSDHFTGRDRKVAVWFTVVSGLVINDIEIRLYV
ncbi:hypothetical protein B0H14DRAFT_2558091 [Mycena olivaceomarginata]|nr:hypothetical protein B0H14DRAFT_2558091 [Mycena olivaceomarginata]